MKVGLLMIILACAGSISAQYPSQYPSRASERQVLDVLNRLDRDIANLRIQMNAQDNTAWDRRERSTALSELESALSRVRSNVSYRRDASTDVRTVIDRARSLDTMIARNSVSAGVRDSWMRIRADLETLGGYYNASANWDRFGTGDDRDENRFGYYTTDTQMRTLVNRLRSNQSLFRSSYNRWARTGWRRILTGNNAEVERSLNEMDQSIARLNTGYNTTGYRQPDVIELMRDASTINQFVTNNRVSAEVTNRWKTVRSDLDTLAGYYRMSWNWTDPNYNPTIPGNTGGFGNFDARLTGTYRLNASQSDNVTAAVNNAIGNSGDATRTERMRRNLERRLGSPEMLAIEKQGLRMTLASSNAPAVELAVDGVARTETGANGRSVTTTVSTTGREVTVNYAGDRMNDFYVSFTPAGRDQLRVTRRVYLENQNSQVTVTSVYDRTDQVARFDQVFTGNPTYAGNSDTFAIPNNTALIATLDTPLSTRTVRDGDRFTMTVSSPLEYRGATIEGTVVNTQRSGVISGNANMGLTFDTIRMRDGRSYRFAGIVDQVRQPNGEVVAVNNEGQIRDSSQTKQTVTRAGIGAALGALIGAIAGGGQGAAIGAAIGGTAGAGSVVLRGRDNLELATGSQFQITATAPPNVARVRP